MNRMLIFALLATFAAPAAPLRFYLGTYTDKGNSRGIYTGTLDAATGTLGPVELAAVAPSPNYLALTPDGKYLYANIATNGGAVAAFRVASGGQLTRLNDLPAGNGGCHVSVDATGRNVFVANYGGGSIASFRTRADGTLAERIAFLPQTGAGPNPQRQTKPYLHSIYAGPGNTQVYACDLGTDSIWTFALDASTGALLPATPAAAKVPPGSGPRHLAWHPSGKFCFVNGEMGLNVTTFRVASPSGALVPQLPAQPTLPADVDTNGFTTAEIVCHPSGRWLYVSNRDVSGRARDSLTVFAIGADGALTRQQNIPAGVKIPRGFGVAPAGDWLVVAGQNDNRITVFKIDPTTGRLTATDQAATVGAPVCVLFAPPGA